MSAVHFQQQKSNHLVQKELQAHLMAHQQMLAGYTDYVKRHTHVLLQLVVNAPQACLLSSPLRSPCPFAITSRNGTNGNCFCRELACRLIIIVLPEHHALLSMVQSPEGSLHSGSISPGEFDRLGLLLRGSAEQSLENGSPMDLETTSPTTFQRTVHSPMKPYLHQAPFLHGCLLLIHWHHFSVLRADLGETCACAADNGWRLSAHVPAFAEGSGQGGGHVSLLAVADWLADNVFDELEPAGARP